MFCALGVASLCAGAAASKLVVDVNDQTGVFSVKVDDDVWFQGADVFVRSAGAEHRLSTGGLVRERSWTTQGADGYGAYDATEIQWSAAGAPFVTSVRVYATTVIFEQRFPEGLNATKAATTDALVSGFPALRIANVSDTKRGYVHWQGSMSGANTSFGALDDADLNKKIWGGLKGTGPLCVFDTQHGAVVSAASAFMSSSATFSDGVLTYGLMGGVEEVPRFFSHETILHFALGAGPNAAMDAWGAKLLKRYRKDRAIAEADFTVNYLGYSTDNGAFYYYDTGAYPDYETTILAVKAYADQVGLPYRHALLDSWWYYRGLNDGVTNWTARADVFPSGLRNLHEKTGWPIVAHNRFWSGETPYAKHNGGAYDFIIEENVTAKNKTAAWALPMDSQFWDFLMQSSKDWGMRVYEQDWLYNEFVALKATKASATLARRWLMQMGQAAARHDVTIQYCMSWPRHILQSVELQAVTQARASADYQPGNSQWRLGLSSMLAHALALTPTKDVFWSTSDQSGSKLYPTLSEPHNRLQAAVSTLSNGPVAVGDAVGKTDVALVLKSCAADGKLLQPDAPATTLDAALFARARLPGADANLAAGELWGASAVVAGLHFRQVLAAETVALTLTPRVVYGGAAAPPPPHGAVAFEANATGAPVVFDEAHPLVLPATDAFSFQLWTFAPLLGNGWALLGETAKWVTASNDRIVDVAYDGGGVAVVVRGQPGERVTLHFLPPASPGRATLAATCTVAESGVVKMTVPDLACIEI
ncbi:hypothetical protein M885DRAFT_95114 [Pelagophyceae sp. CCMP2097]|nr:hypothetical protein M885DRAFT_95114 [Pelagophyceae sp. CCMP2097]